MMDLPDKVWWANEIRIWGVAATAFIGVISFAAAWTHSRWQSELSTQKEEAAAERQRISDEKIAEANARAAEANQKAEEEKLARVKIEERLADRSISDRQFGELIVMARPFAGQEYEVTTFWDLREPMAISNRLSQALTVGGWNLKQPETGRWILGGLEGVEIYHHPRSPNAARAARAITDALNSIGIAATTKQKNVPADSEPEHKLSFNVGTKPR
ncbi:MAG: hypothetical protein K2Y27_02040 [Xanthobacteraceae bacterium]|nr:hypothetical protein [Xanthobacteraceae bacterium]